MASVENISSTSRAGQNTSATNDASRSYTVQRGDTLSEIAARNGVSLAALQRANPEIASQRFIFPGDKLNIPGSNAATIYTVVRGDTLSGIAQANGTTWQALAAANNLARPDRIYPGQHITIPDGAAPSTTRTPITDVPRTPSPTTPAPSATEAPTRVEGASVNGRTLQLTAADVLNLKKTLQTEWVQSAGTDQARGIIDTILNRQASGHWGNSVSSVVNARYQFSDVNGPVAWRQHGRSSVEQIPASMVSRTVNDFVDSYLAERAAGRQSSVGTHLNYANPNYSDAVNLRWINALDGPVFGRGDAIHRHGTTADLQRYRPQPYDVRLP
ncbi:MAG: LysM peptidoglycan-binding domain-containing protein [Parasphingorhabdus sp.]|nr:LysM peptidoglycan-binding domain-containing protein [Parasphingorhabdus sp.]